MRCYISVACTLSVLFAVSHAAPAGVGSLLGEQGSAGLSVGGGFNTTALVTTFNQKIQLLRQFCPQLFQVIDNVVQNITSQVFSIVGRVILRNGLGGVTGGGGGGGGGESRVSVVLPTFPPDDEDYDDEENTEELSNRDGSDSVVESTTSGGLDIRIIDSRTSTTTIGTNEIPLSANEVDTNGAPFTSPASNVIRSRRVIREAEESDQDAAASGGNGPDPADLSDVEAEDSERDKRFLPFGGEAHVSAGGGGSGNFLFDIIRLIAGSGATEESDEKDGGAIGAGGVAEIDVAKSADGYTEGIPGPITRLFVIANRGLANLVQDLILRLAQTSERIVNFKARLITALI